MNRLDDMLKRYGECVSVAETGRMLRKSRITVIKMLDDGRLRRACAGTMVDVRSIVEYIETPDTAERQAAARERGELMRQGRFKV